MMDKAIKDKWVKALRDDIETFKQDQVNSLPRDFAVCCLVIGLLFCLGMLG